MSNDTQPEIRFPGFTEDWEQRELSDISTKVQTKNKDREFTETLTNSAEFGIISQNYFFDKEISNKNNIDGYYVVKPNDFVYNPRISNFAPVGPIKRNKLGRTGVMSPLYYVFSTNNIDNQYLETYFSTSYWHKFMKLNGDSGARADRFAIRDSVFVKMPIPYPSREEQEKIGQFFEVLSNAIALQQRKLDLLKETKKGFLQKMFPKNGAKVPEIRFPGFTKDWEERKLGDVFSERSERSSEGELISVTINSGVIKASELDRKDNSSDNKSNYKKVEVGDIAYNSMRMWQGASGYSSYEGILSPAYTVIIPKEGTDSKFFAYDFKRYDMIQTFKRNSQGLTSDTWNLKFPTLKLVKIMVPSIEEQKQIAAFFERLDNTIALHERELDVLKETKKGFLQKMFV
ncbi:restriction endonuclease subunit S [Enterococcus hirae]|uniref:restriction endonuclease subunit S n=1 Tax=Enterococcus hirae TaxID=1354 RepID=UPI00137355CC|nr:restriction endonuclease subunit S [Enterococcus hirae]NBA19735.1 restriction endonuclease subunit S [Enterococcus hirae]NBA26255.1 restriction endonuclease subunit S [Enterococcus hirae]NBA32911.1 restriction endonuclease subunit S [Enterococcus hirae]NBA35500.1 restriction endonuclease subunit S [Enterococcus hirae]NBA40946.1 restriction endonuclease subunit S [Enterococcus hirae]